MVYSGYILRKLHLYYSYHRYFSSLEHVKDVMGLETGSYTSVYERLYYLPEGL